jgi:hypothetical protein
MKKIFTISAVALSFIAETMNPQVLHIEDESFIYEQPLNGHPNEVSCRPREEMNKCGRFFRKFTPRTRPKNNVTRDLDVFSVTSIVSPSISNLEKDDILEFIYIPASVRLLDKYCFYDCESLREVIFEQNSQLQRIGIYAFRMCRSLESIIVPKSVQSLNVGCFNGCGKLENVTFESDSSLRQIEGYAFCSCQSLESIIIPKSVKFLNVGCFSGCEKLGNITFEPGSNLEWIGEDVFSGCRSLESITIPASVRFIGKSCFNGCEKLKNVTFESGSRLEQIGTCAFFLYLFPKSITVWDNMDITPLRNYFGAGLDWIIRVVND